MNPEPRLGAASDLYEPVRFPPLFGWRANLLRLALVVGFFVLSAWHYELFHAVSEVFCAVVAAAIVVYAWNARAIVRDAYSAFLGAGFLWMIALDLLHAFAFPGIEVLPGQSTNASVQLRIAARFVQALALIGAPLMAKRHPSFSRAGFAFGAVACGAIAAVWRGVLPEAIQIPGWQTPGAQAVELVLCLMFFVAGILTWRARHVLDRETHRLMTWSILLTVNSELCISLTGSRMGIATACGHILKMISFYFVYRAILLRGNQRPFESLYRDVIDSRARFSAVFERMLQPALILGPGASGAFAVQAANSAALNLLARSGAEVLGRPLDDVVGGRALPGLRAALQEVTETGLPATRSMIARHADGTLERWIDLDVFPTAAPEIGVVSRDRTDEMRTVEALRRSGVELRQLHEAQHRKLEEERRRIAQELHDELGQVATALTIGLDRCERRAAETDPRLAETAAKLKGLAASTVDTVRRICAELRPSLLDLLGLPDAIEAKLRDLETETGIETTLHLDVDSVPLDRDLATVLYRILQESLTNVARHSMAGTVTVSLTTSAGRACLTVEDDGRGITAAEAAADTSFGIIGMRERALAAGGTVEVVGTPAAGTRVRVEIPR